MEHPVRSELPMATDGLETAESLSYYYLVTSVPKAMCACPQILLTFPNAISKTGFIGGTTLAIGAAILALWTMCTIPI